MADEKKISGLGGMGRPIGELATGRGLVYLYQAGTDTRSLYGKLKDSPVAERVSETLRRMTSTELRESLFKKIVPLPEEVFNALTDSEIVQLIELFRERRDRQRAVPEKPRAPIDGQRETEDVITFADRVLGEDFAEDDAADQNARQRLLDSIRSPAERLLEDMKASSARLGATIKEFDGLRSPTIALPPLNDHFAEEARRVQRQRHEDRETARLTAEMTKQSAEMLKALVDAAGKFLVRFDERDVKSDRQINIQLWFAVVSLLLSVVLSGFGAWYARAAYKQDAEKNAADDAGAKLSVERDRRYEDLLTQQLKVLHSVQLQIDRGGAQQAPASPQPKSR